MDKEGRFLERLVEGADLSETLIPGQSIVEIAGAHRVLIENHCGIIAYSGEKVILKANFGSIIVYGSSLEIMKMNKEQLVICGQIKGVTLQRRE